MPQKTAYSLPGASFAWTLFLELILLELILDEGIS